MIYVGVEIHDIVTCEVFYIIIIILLHYHVITTSPSPAPVLVGIKCFVRSAVVRSAVVRSAVVVDGHQ